MPTNSEIISASYAAFRRGDVDAALTAFAPDIEWTHPDGMSDYGLGGTKKGHDEVRAFMARARTVFSEVRPEPREYVESGDRVMVIGVHHMRGARSGVAGTVRFVHTWRMAGGKAIQFEDHHDTAEVRRLVESAAAAGPGERVFQLGLGFWAAKVLLSAVELGVFTELAAAPLDIDELRSRLGLNQRAARDFLDALVALGLLQREAGQYANTATTAVLLDRAQPDTYIGGLLEIANEQWYQSWGNLTTALRTGAPQNNAIDGESDPFDVLYSDPERTRKFQQAMTAGAMPNIIALGDKLAWPTLHTVTDIGCSAGALLGHLLRRYSNLTGVGFDLPAVAAGFRDTVTRFGLTDRMSFVPGNFFTDPLPPADIIVFGHILCDWDLATKRMLLRKAHDALPNGGMVVIYDAIIDDERRHNVFGLLKSLHMLLESPGGFEYTGTDCLTWLAETGFHSCHVEHLAGADSMAVGVK